MLRSIEVGKKYGGRNGDIGSFFTKTCAAACILCIEMAPTAPKVEINYRRLNVNYG